MSQRFTLGLIGNPNCGKTTVFNALTGSRQRVGNWPGVTVERVSGEFSLGGNTFEVVDLPGTYSLDVTDQEVSLDEQVARSYAQEQTTHLVVNVVDASNLERNLYLTTQLAEMQVPLLLAVNMTDVAADKGMKVDTALLAQKLGCPVVALAAASGKGVAGLKQSIAQAAAAPQAAALLPHYEPALEQAVERLLPLLPDTASPRWLAVRLLEGDALAQKSAPPAALAAAKAEAAALGEDIGKGQLPVHEAAGAGDGLHLLDAREVVAQFADAQLAEFVVQVGLGRGGGEHGLDGAEHVVLAGLAIAQVLLYNVYETLVKLDGEGNLKPLLAQSWSTSPDRLTYTFTLQPGVTFHSGKPLTAADVKWSIEHVTSADSKSSRKNKPKPQHKPLAQLTG